MADPDPDPDHERDEDISHLLDEVRQAGPTIQGVDTLRESHPDLAEEVLHLSEVERVLHLAVSDWKGAVGDETVSSVGSDDRSETDGKSRLLQAGGPATPAQLGRYRILRCLGEGGMGAVFEADDPQLQRRVAVKVPHFRGSSVKQEQSRRRFLREARAAAAVEHPNVCSIHDVGEHEGRPFVVMAFVEGKTLADHLKTGAAQDCRAAARLIVKIAGGLGAVHTHGIIHRDLKPANILLRGKDGEPILTDFGLAQVASEDDNLTAEGTIVGTPAYMAPEQADPAMGPMTSQTDLYSLGVILFEMVANRRPFEGSTTQIISQISSRAAPRASVFRPDLDPTLDTIIARATARHCKDRYAHAADLARALTDWLRDTKTVSPPRNSRRLALAVGAAVLVSLVVAGFSLFRKDQVENPANTATHPGPGPDEHVQGAPRPGPPLRGAIDIKVWRKDQTDRPAMLLHHPDALPLAPGDWMRIEVDLNRPAHVYIVWIDTEGKATPLYPWIDEDWTKRRTVEQRVKRLSLPESDTGIAPLGGGPAGIETLVLLARDEPLPADLDMEQLFADLPKQKTPDLRAAAWFENGELVRNEVDRGPIRLDKARETDNPVLRTQAILKDRLQSVFSYTRAVSFANKGG